MFLLDINNQIITIAYRNYAWIHERTLGIKDSIVLSALLSMCGIILDLSRRDVVCVSQVSRAGMVCKEFL